VHRRGTSKAPDEQHSTHRNQRSGSGGNRGYRHSLLLHAYVPPGEVRHGAVSFHGVRKMNESLHQLREVLLQYDDSYRPTRAVVKVRHSA
jgi:hypothetical protein